MTMATPTSIFSATKKNKSTPSSTKSATTTKKKTPTKELVQQKSGDNRKATESPYTTKTSQKKASFSWKKIYFCW
jgi:hypothetical protein